MGAEGGRAMGLPNKSVTPGPRAVNPYISPNGLVISCAMGLWVTVPGEQANVLLTCGWIEVPEALNYVLSGSSVNTQTGTAYTLQPSDNGGMIYFTNAAAIQLYVPSGLGGGFECGAVQGGAGQVTAVAGGITVSINNSHGFTKTAQQYSVVSLFAVAPDVFIFAGDGV